MDDLGRDVRDSTPSMSLRLGTRRSRLRGVQDLGGDSGVTDWSLTHDGGDVSRETDSVSGDRPGKIGGKWGERVPFGASEDWCYPRTAASGNPGNESSGDQ